MISMGEYLKPLSIFYELYHRTILPLDYHLLEI
jgi:hypothetical protein